MRRCGAWWNRSCRAPTAHDAVHVLRVYENAMWLADAGGADLVHTT